MKSSDYWDREVASRYDEDSAVMFRPEVLDPTVDFLAELAGPGPALEFAIGTGRVAIPLLDRGIPITGIELSQPMCDVLHAKRPELPVIIGDMATTAVPGLLGTCTLVYLVWNSLGNVRTQEQQVAVFENAAAHLAPGGRFVVELWIPGIRRMPPGQSAVAFHLSDDHAGFDIYDLVNQQGTSHHYRREPNGCYRHDTTNFRYAWPAELDLMARLAGLGREQRVAGWDNSEFTNQSESHISVWRKPEA